MLRAALFITGILLSFYSQAQHTYLWTGKSAKETSLEVYFIDRKGMFFPSVAKLQLVDSVKGDTVEFLRTVNSSGQPDTQKVLPGVYNVRVAGRQYLLGRGVPVKDKWHNKVVFLVDPGSLRFRYVDTNGDHLDQPVTEYEAIVVRRPDSGKTLIQRCNEEKDYPPGNYYVEVNTYPVTRFNVDIDFDATTELHLILPGTLALKPGLASTVSFYQYLDVEYVRISQERLEMNQQKQFRMKPGYYEAHWIDPNGGTENTQRFTITSVS